MSLTEKPEPKSNKIKPSTLYLPHNKSTKLIKFGKLKFISTPKNFKLKKLVDKSNNKGQYELKLR
ncbi:hypothetical protein MAH4_34610 [Sessilibacter sp. MAH4]